MSGFPDLFPDLVRDPFAASTLGGGGGGPDVIRFDSEPEDEETEPWQGPPKERLRKETAVCYLGHMEWENGDTAETGDSGWGEHSPHRRTPPVRAPRTYSLNSECHPPTGISRPNLPTLTCLHSHEEAIHPSRRWARCDRPHQR